MPMPTSFKVIFNIYKANLEATSLLKLWWWFAVWESSWLVSKTCRFIPIKWHSRPDSDPAVIAGFFCICLTRDHGLIRSSRIPKKRMALAWLINGNSTCRAWGTVRKRWPLPLVATCTYRPVHWFLSRHFLSAYCKTGIRMSLGHDFSGLEEQLLQQWPSRWVHILNVNNASSALRSPSKFSLVENRILVSVAGLYFFMWCYFCSSFSALTVYEYFITLAREALVIWSGRLTITKGLFLLNRYSFLIYQICNLFRFLDDPKVCLVVVCHVAFFDLQIV